jgi:hypothetical protein
MCNHHLKSNTLSFSIHIITTCFGLTRPSSGVCTLAKIVALSSQYVAYERVIFKSKVLKIFRVHRISDSADLHVVVSVGASIVVLACEHQLPAELVYSACDVHKPPQQTKHPHL